MSLVFTLGNCTLISHEDFINQIYNDVQSSDQTTQSKYAINSSVFDLNTPYRTKTKDEIQSRKKQRKIINKTRNVVANEHREEYELIERIKLKTEEFMKACQERSVLPTIDSRSNERLKEFLDKWQSVECLQSINCHGGNDASKPCITELNGSRCLVPANSRFFNMDISKFKQQIDTSPYDVVVIDPPWWNKYVRRSKMTNRQNGYQMLTNEAIADIPINELTQPNRTLVAIWCTNAPSIIQAVKELLLPNWKLRLVATWYWIKITKCGETICDFDLPLKKQPFERIFIACHEDSTIPFDVPKEKLIFSVPSAIHSHKPPLQELFVPHIECDGDISSIEIFARYLLPNCTSVGLEVLKLQNLFLFHEQNEKCDAMKSEQNKLDNVSDCDHW